MASTHKRTWTNKAGTKKTAFEVRYFDDSGAQRSKSFDRKREADDFAFHIQTGIREGRRITARGTITVLQVAEEFLGAAEARHRDRRRMGTSHLRGTTSMVRNHILPSFGTRAISDVKWTEVDRWARALGAEKKLAPSTVKRVMHFFKVLFDFAIRRQYVSGNALQEAMKDWRGVRVDPVRQFAIEDVRTLIETAALGFTKAHKRNIAMLRVVIQLAAFCGLRYGEIMGLRWEDVDVAARVLHVRHNLTAWDELKDPKTRAGLRDVPLPQAVANLFVDWQRHYVANDRGLVFRTPSGKQIAANGFHGCHWKPLLVRAGLAPKAGEPWLHFHALHHFAASMMIDDGLPVTDVASLLGHAKFDMTLQVYAHPIAGGHRRHEAPERMTAAFAQPEFRIVSHEPAKALETKA